MIRLHKVAPSGTILIDAPSSCNALTREMVRQLLDAISDFHQDKSIRGIILSSKGEHFCSGINLKEWHETSQSRDAQSQWQEIADELQELVEALLRLPKPVIAAIDGPVRGIGVALACAADLVVASSRAEFSAPAPKIGLVSGLLTPLITFRCGGSTAARILLGRETLQAPELHRLGIVHRLVSSDQIWAAAHDWIDNIAEGSADAVGLTKRLLNEMIGESLMMQLSSGSAMMSTAANTESAVEGMRAFVEKRPPKFP
jgi:enoyl-CoA hydratase/carnithine racemase